MSKVKDLYADLISLCKEQIDHHCDGPMSPLVAINRACKLANTYPIEVCAEACEEVMVDYGWLVDPYVIGEEE